MTTVSVDGSRLYSEKNTYDGNGSLLERVTSGNTVVTEQTGASVQAEYAYDALDRLISETVDGITTTYTYDTIGNRVSKTVDGVQTTYTYDLCNKLLSEVTEAQNVPGAATGTTIETGVSVTTTYRYDSIGNLTEKITAEGTTTYTYDALNQLTKTVNADGTWQESTYDASGIRSMLSENGITTEYVSYNGLALTGYDTSGEQTEHYYYGTSLLAAELVTATSKEEYRESLYYYIKNSHGDVIGLSDNDGTLTENYTYDAFGTLTYVQSMNENGVFEVTDTAVSRFLYAGEQYDAITGLYYLRARRYDTTAGRFTQEDTYLGDGRNLYVYVGNNPLKYVDPSGHCSKILGYYGVYELYNSNAMETTEEVYMLLVGVLEIAWGDMKNDPWGYVHDTSMGMFQTIVSSVSLGGVLFQPWYNPEHPGAHAFGEMMGGIYTSSLFKKLTGTVVESGTSFCVSTGGAAAIVVAPATATVAAYITAVGVYADVKTINSTGKFMGELSESFSENVKRVVNGFGTEINSGKQGKHIIGHNNYIEGRNIFNGSIEDAQKLVDEYAGTGEWIGINKERVDFGKIIGQYFDPVTGGTFDTSVGIIYYSTKGVHIVPARPMQ